MLGDLLAIVGSREFDEAGGVLRVRAAAFSERGLSIDLELRVEAESAEWLLTCEESAQHRLCGGFISTLQVESEHPLLWRFNKPQRAIYFRGTTASPHALIGAIAEAHVDMVGNWLPLDAFLNSGVRLSELLAGGHGLFADGPQPVLDAYERVLTEHGLAVSPVLLRAPRSTGKAISA